MAKVLVVDDDPALVKTLADILRRKGHDVTTADRGESALARVRMERLQEPFDAAILDINLPGLSGLELLETIKAISPDTEIIFITAYASLDTAIEAIDRDAFAYLVKPFEVDQLLSSLDRALEAGAARERERRRARQALRESEDRYRVLVESARDVIFTMSTDGVFTSLNPIFEELTGWPRNGWIGRPFAAIVHPEDLPRFSESFQGFLRGERLPAQEVRVLTKSGEYRIGEVTASLRVQDGEVVGVLGIARDITERKQAQDALRRLNEIQEEVARRIAHALHDEAGQVLASVYLEVAEVARELPPPAREKVERIWQLLDQVHEQLRRLSHELRPTILDDLGLVPALEFLAEGVAKRTGLQVTVKGGTEGRLPVVIETALYRIVQEALTNVTRHARAASVRVEIQRDAQAIRCAVRDDGVGFDVPAMLARAGGRGLGLLGIRERLNGLGGALSITAAPGQGTELAIALPLKG